MVSEKRFRDYLVSHCQWGENNMYIRFTETYNDKNHSYKLLTQVCMKGKWQNFAELTDMRSGIWEIELQLFHKPNLNSY